MSIELILTAIVASKEYVELGLAVIALIGVPLGSARGAIATVNEIMAKGADMTNDEALQKASDLMGKWIPYIPDFVRKWIIQQAFDSMKKKALEILPKKKKVS